MKKIKRNWLLTALLLTVTILSSSCKKKVPPPKLDQPTIEWQTVLLDCKPDPIDETIYICPKAVLARAYDIMADLYFDIKDCDRDRFQGEQECRISIAKYRNELSVWYRDPWIWVALAIAAGAIGFGAGGLTFGLN